MNILFVTDSIHVKNIARTNLHTFAAQKNTAKRENYKKNFGATFFKMN